MALVLALASLAGPGAFASERRDHDEAREALARGQVMPLQRVLEHLARQRPGGHVLEVELEHTRGRWVYEIKQVDSGGQLVKLRLDARSGELLNERSPRGPATPVQGTPR